MLSPPVAPRVPQAVVSASSTEISWNRDPIGGQVRSEARFSSLVQRFKFFHPQVVGDATAIAFSTSSIITVPAASSAASPVYSVATAVAAAVQFAATAIAVQAGSRPTAVATSAMTVCRFLSPIQSQHSRVLTMRHRSNGGVWQGNNPSLLCSCDERHVGVECQIECPLGA
jgi:hypothetical protein